MKDVYTLIKPVHGNVYSYFFTKGDLVFILDTMAAEGVWMTLKVSDPQYDLDAKGWSKIFHTSKVQIFVMTPQPNFALTDPILVFRLETIYI